MGFIALLAFWGVAIRLWIVDGPQIPLVFIGMWALAYYVFPILHWSLFFLTFEAILTVILLIVEKFKSSM
jgi:hypothetical protein